MLYRGARILILDEPTAVLVPQEVDELFHSLARAEGRGRHGHLHLPQARRGADRRRRDHRDPGRARRSPTVEPGGGHRPRAGRADGRLRAARRRRPASPPSPTSSSSRSTTSVVRGRPASRCSTTCRFEVRRGEIVGIAGVEGNGQTELIEALIGLAQLDRRHASRSPARTSPRGRPARRREAGVGYIPEDRHRDGLLLTAPLWENAMLGHQTQAPNAHGLWIDRDGARRRTERDRRRVRRAHARHRRRRPRAVGRQPAEADRRPGDDRPSRRC